MTKGLIFRPFNSVDTIRFAAVLSHLFLIVAANYFAFWLRFDGAIPESERQIMLRTLPILLIIRASSFIAFRLYKGLWRYTGIWDLEMILGAVLSSSAVFYMIVHKLYGLAFYPRSVFIIDSLVLILLLAGVRMTRRVYESLPTFRSTKRVLIYGAGDTGEMIARDMRSHAGYGFKPVGFVDDDPEKIGRHIHGIPVLGASDELAEIIANSRPQEVILTVPMVDRAAIRNVVQSLEELNVVIKRVPNLREFKSGSVYLDQMQTVSSDDLLDRMPVGLDLEPVVKLLKGKAVMVTGAGGSIGSELCRQIAAYEPAVLILLDKAESSLFAIDNELAAGFPLLKKVPVLVDIKHTNPLREILEQHAPQVILHAAAYKHVPMMEFHPEEAVLNNVVGTCRLASLAIEYKVERFMLVSTDKAVNPTNVMGATKRLAELYLDALECNAQNESTIFSTVRFGNVLGSSGSVVPTFRSQIAKGGPVTVTHPEITRYFMTIPEAIQLVLRAVTMAKGGEIFVLDMGKPVRLVDMARNLIRTAGFVPDKDIAIKFIGLRPGEKLHEELVGVDEKVEATDSNRILRISPSKHQSLEALLRHIQAMENLAIHGKSEDLMKMLCEIVPNFTADAHSPETDDIRQIAS